jgi:hypothetical protein
MWGSWNWHNQPTRPYTHLYYDGIGNRLQVQELELRAAGQLELNPYFISAETEDYGKWFLGAGTTCGNIPAWRDEQEEVLAKDIAWCQMRFKFPMRLMRNSCESGIGYHRLGIPGGPEYKSSCPKTSTAIGKCCPDWRRIHQIKFEIFPEAQRLVGVSPSTDWFDMATKAELTSIVRSEIARSVQFVAAGRNNAVYDPRKESMSWLAEAVSLPKLLEAASSRQPAETMVDAAEFKTQIAPGGFLHDTFVELIREALTTE